MLSDKQKKELAELFDKEPKEKVIAAFVNCIEDLIEFEYLDIRVVDGKFTEVYNSNTGENILEEV